MLSFCKFRVRILREVTIINLAFERSINFQLEFWLFIIFEEILKNTKKKKFSCCSFWSFFLPVDFFFRICSSTHFLNAFIEFANLKEQYFKEISIKIIKNQTLIDFSIDYIYCPSIPTNLRNIYFYLRITTKRNGKNDHINISSYLILIVSANDIKWKQNKANELFYLVLWSFYGHVPLIV